MINRKALLQLMGAALLSSCAPDSKPQGMKIIVVGAGIIGASIAYHLSKLGVFVTVIDAVGPATQTSRGTFAWINATWAKQPKSYHTLNQQGISSWGNLQRTLNIPVKWSGSLEWFGDVARQQRLESQITEQIEWGEPAHMATPNELARLEPNVDFAGASSAAYSGNDGAVDPVIATMALLRAAEKNGARIKYPCELLDVSLRNGNLRSIETSLGTIKADKIILATGANPKATERFAETKIPQRTTPGIIAISQPTPPLLNRIIVAPGVHMHQRLDGRIVLGEQDGAPGNDAHKQRLQQWPVSFPTPELADQHFYRILAIAEKFVPQIRSAKPEAVHIGWRPLPLDGHPVLGFSTARPDVYMAIMHSGVSLAPIIGQLVAQEVTTGTPIPQLDLYRPNRAFKHIKRY